MSLDSLNLWVLQETACVRFVIEVVVILSAFTFYFSDVIRVEYVYGSCSFRDFGLILSSL